MEDKEVYFVCVDKSSSHIPDSILTHCCKCGKEVWLSLHNADKKPICMPCVMKMPPKDMEFGVTQEDMERSMQEIAKIEVVRERVFDNCLKYQPKWTNDKAGLRAIINLSDRHGDGFKRVTVGDKTYLVPIEDIICLGIKAEEVPKKYKEE